MDELLDPWTAAWGTTPEVVAVGRDVLARYEEPHRRHHDRRHLAEVLAALELLSPTTPVPAPVVAAAYWHDAVYDGRPDDERRSADLADEALTALGAAPAVVAEVVRLVLLTVTHAPAPGDRAGALLSDADLAVLAAPEARYLDYARGVREEHAHVDDEAFRTGRSAVLRTLLERPRLYATAEGHRRWDGPARRNLRAELSRWASGGGAAPHP